MKVMTIVGTRPEVIKLCLVINEFDRNFQHVLVHTGQNFDYELNGIFFDQLNIRKPDYFLDASSDAKNVAHSIGNIIKLSDDVMDIEKPDALLIYGDTNSCLSVISAKRRKIPIFHLEAGNRCFDQRVPEEINRSIVDHLSDINMPQTDHARRYLISEGIEKECIIKVGSPMKEILTYFKPQIKSSKILDDLPLTKNDYFVMSIHREENVDDKNNLQIITDTIRVLEEEYKIPILISTHPRTKKKLSKLNLTFSKNILFSKPLGFFDYIFLQQNSKCVISDSGTITEESSILNFPAVTLRNNHERPEGMDAGTLIMSGLNTTNIFKSIELVIFHHENYSHQFSMCKDYDVDNFSKKISRIILSYTNYINFKVWNKN